MKRILLLATLTATLVALSTGASANTVARLWVNVPFDFYVGAQQLPAGQYIFALRPISLGAAASSSIAVFKRDGTMAAWLATLPGSGVDLAGDHLHFNKYGQRYFLSKVESWGYQANLRVTQSERELRAKANKGQGMILLAMN